MRSICCRFPVIDDLLSSRVHTSELLLVPARHEHINVSRSPPRPSRRRFPECACQYCMTPGLQPCFGSSLELLSFFLGDSSLSPNHCAFLPTCLITCLVLLSQLSLTSSSTLFGIFTFSLSWLRLYAPLLSIDCIVSSSISTHW